MGSVSELQNLKNKNLKRYLCPSLSHSYKTIYVKSTKMGGDQSRQIRISSAYGDKIEIVGSTKRLEITSKLVKNQRLFEIEGKIAKKEGSQGAIQKLIQERELILKYKNDTVQSIQYEVQKIKWSQPFYFKQTRTLKFAEGSTFFSAFSLKNGVKQPIFTNKSITQIKEYGYLFYQFQGQLRYGHLQKDHHFRLAKGQSTIGMGNYPPGFHCECGQRFKCKNTCRFYEKNCQFQNTQILTQAVQKSNKILII